MSGPRLRVTSLVVEYGRAPAVDHVSVDVGPGECVGLVGANGAGKSSLMRCVAGAQKPASGRIEFDGRDITRGSAWRLARQGLRLVPEGRELFWRLSVEENLKVGVARSGVRDHNAAIAEVLAIFSALEPLRHHPAGLLSGGQQQMLAVARALVGQPQVLLLDEPTLGLAPSVSAMLVQAVRAILDRGVAVLVAEQNLGLPRQICNVVHLMRLGRVVASGSPAEVFRDEVVKEAFLTS